MKRILVIALSETQRDPRVMRQIAVWGTDYDLTVAGYGSAPDDIFDFVQIPRKLSLWEKARGVIKLVLGAYESFYWQNDRMQAAWGALHGSTYDLVIANDVDTLPLALKVADNAPVLLDAHEYAPRQFEDRLVWKTLFQPYVDYLCRTYLPKTAAMFAVCQGIADEYKRCYGVDPVVVTNACSSVALSPTAIDSNCIRMVHHGRCTPSRKIEGMIEMFNFLDDRFRLDFMLVPSNKRYLRKIKRLAAHDRRIGFVEPVPMAEIPVSINAYDVGLFLLPPTNFNYRHALPNKFFEFVQARLAVAIGPSPEMARLARQYGFGIVAESFDPRALARELNRLSADDISDLKAAAHHAAGALSGDVNRDLLCHTVERLLGHHHVKSERE